MTTLLGAWIYHYLVWCTLMIDNFQQLYIVHVRNSPHSWNDALTFGLTFLAKLTKLWRITGCINLSKSCLWLWKWKKVVSPLILLDTNIKGCTWPNCVHEHLWFIILCCQCAVVCVHNIYECFAFAIFLKRNTDPQNRHIPYRRSERRQQR